MFERRRCGSSGAVKGKPLTDSLEQSSIVPQEGAGQVCPPQTNTPMPMQNTLPSLLVTAIFLKLVSSRAPETSLSLELPEGVKWADNQGAGKYISVVCRNRCVLPPWINLMPQPPNALFSFVFSLVGTERKGEKKTFSQHLYATTLARIQSPRKSLFRTVESGLSAKAQRYLSNQNMSFSSWPIYMHEPARCA